jgi:hypothetical protein
MKRLVAEKLLHPTPGSQIAAARDYGIDLTLLVENLRLTPEQRLERLQQAMIGIEDLRREAKREKADR